MSDAALPAAPPRLPPLRGFVPTFAWGLRHVVRWRRVLLAAAAVVGLSLLIGLGGVRGPGALRHLAEALDEGVLRFGLPLVALVLASEGFTYEVQAHTLVFHLVRPVSRRTFFLARFLAGYVPALLVATLFLGALVASSGVAAGPRLWLSLPVTAGLGVLCLSAIYYTLSSIFRHGLIVGLVYTFVVETMITSVPGSLQKFSVMFHVRSLHHRLTEGLLPTTAPTGSRDPLAALAVADDTIAEAVLILLAVAVLALAAGAWWIRRRDFALRD